EYLLTFIKELGYSGKCDMLSTIQTDQMHQPWRTFTAAMYNQKNVDYVALIWEDFMYQADNRKISSARKEHMSYLRFKKFIIDHFISKYNTISMRHKINLHTVRDDSLLGTLKFVSNTKDCQKYGALIPNGMINDDIKLSAAYKTYLDYTTGKVPPKKVRKFKKHASPKLRLSLFLLKNLLRRVIELRDLEKRPLLPPTNNVVIRDTPDNEDESDDVYDEDDNDDDDSNDDDSGNDAQDSERTDSDDDENPSFTLKDYEEEEQDEEYVHTPKKDKHNDEDKMHEEEDDVAKELNGDLNIT
nr:hypothetical protein [Tanacetum cinerariifolium]